MDQNSQSIVLITQEPGGLLNSNVTLCCFDFYKIEHKTR